MKKLIILAATTALIAGGCGKKEKAETKMDDAKVEMTDAAEKTMGSDTKESTYGSDSKEKTAGSATEESTYGSDSAEKTAGSGTETTSNGLSAGDRTMMVDSCVKDGTSQEVCACTVGKMEESLSDDAMNLLVKIVKTEASGDEAAAMELMTGAPQAQGMEIMTAMMAAESCKK